ncbi:DoxX family protein [Arthrobacter sp. Sa2CUA1]|uniref:DoxX family protein n=1 Tax=Arthrobacter gallicola TaxID=2762225 RepID=A0ABR8USD4_9MICC|nr:DoxX family membrane protein [Arthrobacter gallicola]MBD7995433.1 DoxX family protein [Arthrobacter gallicola]
MTIVRTLARPLLAAGFVAAGVERLRNAEQTAQQLSPTLSRLGTVAPSAAGLADNPVAVARVLGATQLGAAAMLGLGKFSRLAGLVLAGTAGVNTLVEYRNADATTQEGRKIRRTQLLKNLSLIGGVLLAAVDTNGRPGLAWRAEHLVSDTGRNVRALGKDAGRRSRKITKQTKKQLAKADRTVRSAATDIVGS